MVRTRLVFALAVFAMCGGCALTEVRSKHKVGVEYRHSGRSATNEDRYSLEQGLEFKWEEGVTTGVTYRRRDSDDGGGDNDNGVWFDVSFPIWKAKDEKQADLLRRLGRLEREVAALKKANAFAPVTASNQ